MGSTPLVVDSCDSISALRLASVHPESVTLQQKQADLISRMSDVYHSTDYGMSIVHVYGHQNSGKLDSNLTSVAYLNVQLYAKSEVIMASLLIFP